MKVVLTHGYFIDSDPKEQAIMRPYPPLGILYISAFLSNNGVVNDVFDTTFSSEEELKTYLLKSKPDVVAFYVNLMTKVTVIRLAAFMKEHPDLIHTKVIFGGPDVTYNVDNYLSAGADIIVIGEGEQTMLELINTLKNGGTLISVDGIAFKKDGQLFKTASREKLKTLDALPIPDRGAIDMSKYLEVWKTYHGKSAISVSTQRGCPYTCKWCSTAVYGQSYRRRSPERVVEELINIKTAYNPDTIWFVDDVFTVSHKWLNEFCEQVNNKGAVIPFECITRADRLNKEVLKVLKKSGCFRVWIGAESGSQKIIDAMDRRVHVEQVRKMIQSAKKVGIETGTFIMVGYPGENEKDIHDTIDHLKIATPDLYTITLAYPIKGTDLYKEVEDKIVAFPDWNTSTDRDLDFIRNYSRRYYDFAIRHVYNEVNAHKAFKSGAYYAGFKFKVKSAATKVGMLFSK